MILNLFDFINELKKSQIYNPKSFCDSKGFKICVFININKLDLSLHIDLSILIYIRAWLFRFQ